MDYTLYNNQYRHMEKILQQINRGTQNSYVHPVSTSGSKFSDLLKQTQAAENTISAGSMDAVFEEAARVYNVPVNLLKAIGKAESNFDPSAQSAAGAQGVMQLMPQTAASLGVADPFDAQSNIMGGAKYISGLLDQYDGDVDLALAAYNAGSGNVAKYGGIPPFSETQNYVRKVKEYMGSSIQIDESTQNVSGLMQQTGAALQCPICGGSQKKAAVSDMTVWLAELLKLQVQSRMLSVDDYTGTVL